jgi:acyl carrier protein
MENLIKLVAKVLNVKIEDLSLESSINDIEEWDSLSHLRLISELEESLGIEIPFDEIKNIKKIGDFLRYFNKG